MKRLQAAGINPAMAYSKGTINNVQGQTAKYQSSRLDQPKIPAMQMPTGIINTYQDTRMKNAQISNVEQSTSNLATQNAINVLREAGLSEDNKSKIRNNLINEKYQANAARLTNELRTKQGTLLDKKVEYQTELNRLAKEGLSPTSNNFRNIIESLWNKYKETQAAMPKDWMKMSDAELWEFMKSQQNR